MAESPAEEAVRRDVLLERLAGDEEVMYEIVELGLVECPRLRWQLHAAAVAGDSRDLERAAHALRGVMVNLAAREAVELAHEMEAAARNKDVDRATSLLPAIHVALQRVEAALKHLLARKGQTHGHPCCGR